MEITINYFAIVLAALSTMFVGSVWYTPKVFGNTWMKLAKVDPNQKVSGWSMTSLLGGAFLTSLITAFVLAYFAGVTHKAFGGSFLNGALFVGLLGWLGFTATRIHMHDSFEGRRKKLTSLNIAHEFVAIMIMALIIGVMGI